MPALIKRQPVTSPLSNQTGQLPPSKSKPTPTRPPSTFNFQYFKQLKTPEQMHEYAEETLGKPTCGVSRCVWPFRIGGKKLALKIVRLMFDGHPIKDVEQNKNEAKASACMAKSPNFTHVVKYDDKNFIWIVAELAEVPFNEQNFERYTGISWDEFELASEGRTLGSLLRNLRRQAKQGKAVVEKSVVWLENLLHDIKTCKIDQGDLHTGNWGQIDGRPVILDYGV